MASLNPTSVSTPPKRWSNIVSIPHSVVTPTTIQDLVDTISYAATNNLKIVPVGGGHGSFVSITDRTIYLPMSNFTSINLDEEKSEVTIGGGCITGDVLQHLAQKGWYTFTVNSNAVGVVGALLGGGNHNLCGKHGYGVDYIRSISILPFAMPDGSIPTGEIVLSKDSQGEEKSLWNAIRGAGHGHGIITSVTLAAYPISSLNLTENKIWSRRLIFPAPAVETAITTFLNLPSSPPELAASMLFLRAPPTAPVPGEPMIMIGMNYFGPAADAEKLCVDTFAEEITTKCIAAMTTMVDFGTMNDGVAALNRYGGYKDFHGGFVSAVSAEGIQGAFTSWLSFTGENPASRGSSYVLISRLSTAKSTLNALEDPTPFVGFRDRGTFVQASLWYAGIDEKAKADHCGEEVLEGLRKVDVEAGKEKKGFANNWLQSMNIKDVYNGDSFKELNRVKSVWDKQAVGWNPATDGW